MVEGQVAPLPLRRATAEPAALLLRGVLSPDVADRCAAELARVPDAGRRVGGAIELLRGLDVDDDAVARLLHERLAWRRREIALALGADEGSVADWVADPPDAPRVPAHHVDPSLVQRRRAGAEALAVVVADRLTSAVRWRRPLALVVAVVAILLLVLGALAALDLLGTGGGVRSVAVDDVPDDRMDIVGDQGTATPDEAPASASPSASADVGEAPGAAGEPDGATGGSSGPRDGRATATTDDGDEATGDGVAGDGGGEPPPDGAWRATGPTPTRAALTATDPRPDVAVGDEVATTDGRVWLVVDVEPAAVDHILRTDWSVAGGSSAVTYVLVPSGAERFVVRSPLDLVVVPGTLVATADDETDDVPPVEARLEVPAP